MLYEATNEEEGIQLLHPAQTHGPSRGVPTLSWLSRGVWPLLFRKN